MSIAGLHKEIAKLRQAVAEARPNSYFYHYYSQRLQQAEAKLAALEASRAA